MVQVLMDTGGRERGRRGGREEEREGLWGGGEEGGRRILERGREELASFPDSPLRSKVDL